jgi:CBS domain-containing protein
MGTNGRPPQTVAHVMTSDVITCGPDDAFERVTEILEDNSLSGLPVVNPDGRLVGVISERDLAHVLGNPLVRQALRRPLHSANALRELDGMAREDRRAQNLMSAPAITVHPDTPIHTAAEIMVKEQIGRLPVTVADRVIGIVTRGDILRGISGVEI